MGLRKRRDRITIEGVTYTIIRVLGVYGGGRRYIVIDNDGMFVLKDYGDNPEKKALETVRKEKQTTELLSSIGIAVPKVIAIDEEKKLVLKEFIEGVPVSGLIMKGELTASVLEQARNMSKIAEEHGLCLDFFPTNFVVSNGKLYYFHFECMPYSEEYSLGRMLTKFWMDGKVLMQKLIEEGLILN